MKKYLLFTIAFIIPSSILWACSCFTISTFCETITFGNNGVINEENTIIKAEIINKETDGIGIKIESVLFGETNSQELFINRGNGVSCTVDTEIFSAGEVYLFNLYAPSSNQEIYLGDCGINFLKIENNTITGAIAPNVESIDLDELNTIECFEEFMLSFSNLSSLKNFFSVFPNPTDGIFSILNDNEIPVNNIIEIEMVDLQGRVIYREQKVDGWLPNEEWNINVREIATGIYFLKFFVEEKSSVLKIVKM